MKIRGAEDGPLLSGPRLLGRLEQLDHKEILELGCGAGSWTRQLASGGPGRRVLALEVDRAQHEANLAIDDLPGVRFGLGPAQAIPAGDESFDAVFMFKSLHHVPGDQLDRALEEIARVLRREGRAYLVEPIYGGALNEIMKLFNDERRAREAAFAAVRAAVGRGLLELERQLFFRLPLAFASFAEFERRMINVSYRRSRLSPEVHAEVRARVEAHLTDGEAAFTQPLRLDQLQRPR